MYVVQDVTLKKLKNILLSGSFLFYVMSGVSSVLNYAMYPMISNIVDLKTFGEIQFLLTAFNQLSLGFVVLNILSILVSANNLNDYDKKRKLFNLNIVASIIAGVVSIVGVAVLIIFKDQLQLESVPSMLMLGVGLVVNAPFTVMIGQLQGDDKFMQSGIISLIATFLKLVFAFMFIKAGFGSFGALFGVALGMLASMMIGLLVNPDLKLPTKNLKISLLKNLKSPAIYSFILIGTLTILSSVDLIMARVVLSAEDAGVYSGIATITKIILAVLSPILWLSMPIAVKRNKKLINKYIILAILISIVFVIFSYFGTDFIMTKIMSINASTFNGLAGILSLSMSFYALTNILAGVSIGSSIRVLSLAVIYIISLTIFLFYLLFVPEKNLISIIILQTIVGIILFVFSIINLKHNWNKKIV